MRIELLKRKVNVAAAVTEETKEKLLQRFPEHCFDGDLSDLRFLDTMTGSLCLLAIKGREVDPDSPFIMSYREAADLINEVAEFEYNSFMDNEVIL